jgi:hypothetical protein
VCFDYCCGVACLRVVQQQEKQQLGVDDHSMASSVVSDVQLLVVEQHALQAVLEDVLIKIKDHVFLDPR